MPRCLAHSIVDDGNTYAAQRGNEQVLINDKVVRRIQLRRLQDQDSYFLERIALDSRVLIIEGISGSGKDTFQTYLKKNISEHLHHSNYHTPELAELVLIRDRPLIERFGYVFEQASLVENGGPKPLD